MTIGIIRGLKKDENPEVKNLVTLSLKQKMFTQNINFGKLSILNEVLCKKFDFPEKSYIHLATYLLESGCIHQVPSSVQNFWENFLMS